MKALWTSAQACSSADSRKLRLTSTGKKGNNKEICNYIKRNNRLVEGEGWRCPVAQTIG